MRSVWVEGWVGFVPLGREPGSSGRPHSLSEYDETAWSARTWFTFVAQRLSVAEQLSMAQLLRYHLPVIQRVNPCATARRRIPSAPVEGVMQGDPTVHTPIHRPVRHYMIQSGTCLTETVSLLTLT